MNYAQLHGQSEDPTLFDFIRQVLDYEPKTGNLIWVYDWGYGKSHTIAGYVKPARPVWHGETFRCVGLDYKKYKSSTLVWFWMTGKWKLVKHLDGNPLNDCWTNLYVESRSQP